MTDRERANKLLLEHTALEHLKEDMPNNWECIIDTMLKFRNEGLREEIEKFMEYLNRVKIFDTKYVVGNYFKTKE